MEKINFSKYHGCGNDFIIVKEEDIKDIDLTSFIISICNRYTGIGADGLMIDVKDKVEMKFYNQDGRSGTMCGNGLRSFAAYLKDIKKEGIALFFFQLFSFFLFQKLPLML